MFHPPQLLRYLEYPKPGYVVDWIDLPAVSGRGPVSLGVALLLPFRLYSCGTLHRVSRGSLQVVQGLARSLGAVAADDLPSFPLAADLGFQS